MRLVQNKSQRRRRVSLHWVIPSLQLWKLRLIVKLEKAVPEKKLSLSKGQGSGDKRLALWACSFVLEILVIILTFMSLEWIYVLRPWGNSDKWRRTKYDKAALKFWEVAALGLPQLGRCSCLWSDGESTYRWFCCKEYGCNTLPTALGYIFFS